LIKYIGLLFLFYFISASSQYHHSTWVSEGIEEKVFIHLNKPVYSLTDTLWFKAYVTNQNNAPSFSTTLLYVNLLNQRQDLIATQRIHIKNGVGHGQIEFELLPPGEYYIQGYTNFMRNFDHGYIFEKKIKIVADAQEILTTSSSKYITKIAIEGGFFLENAQTTVALQLQDKGKGIDYQAKILNSKKDEIASFDTSHAGLAKSSFYYQQNETYIAVVKVKETILEIELPKAKKTGLLMIVENTNDSLIKVHLKTNSATLKEKKGNDYELRNGIGHLQFKLQDTTQAIAELYTHQFKHGINKLVLYKNGQPVSQRKIYVHKSNSIPKIDLQKVASADQDSIAFRVKLTNQNQPLKANVSLSVLASNHSLSYADKSISGALLFTPLLKENVELINCVEDIESPNCKSYLDLVLLMQGTSIDSIGDFKKFKDTISYEWEVGIKLKGRIEGELKTDTLALLTNYDLLIDKIVLKHKREFQFDSLLVYNSDTLKLAFLDLGASLMRPDNLVIDVLEEKSSPPVLKSLKTTTTREQDKIGDLDYSAFQNNTTVLDEVLLLGKAKSERKERREMLLKKYSSIVWDIGKYFELELLEFYPFYKDDVLSFLAFKENVELRRNKNGEYYLIRAGKESELYIDGEVKANFDLLHVNLNMRDVESIMVQPRGGSRVYQVFTTEDYKRNLVRLYQKQVIKEAYQKPKPYSLPKQINLEQDLIPVEIDWKPVLKTNDFGEVYFKIPKSEIFKYYHLQFEGFSRSGILILKDFKISQ
jgi:hypothetical protein